MQSNLLFKKRQRSSTITTRIAETNSNSFNISIYFSGSNSVDYVRGSNKKQKVQDDRFHSFTQEKNKNNTLVDQMKLVLFKNSEQSEKQRIQMDFNNALKEAGNNCIARLKNCKNSPDRMILDWFINSMLAVEKQQPFLDHFYPVKHFEELILRKGSVWITEKFIDWVKQLGRVLNDEKTQEFIYLRCFFQFYWWIAPMVQIQSSFFDNEEAKKTILHALLRYCFVCWLNNWTKKIQRANFSRILYLAQNGTMEEVLKALQICEEETKKATYRLAAIDFNSGYRRNLVKFILIWLNDHIDSDQQDDASNDQKVLQMKDIEIEHVLPQNPMITTDNQSMILLNALGNLVLLPKTQNSIASNYTFELKKSIYSCVQDQFPLLREIMKFESWCPFDILKNHLSVIKLIANYFQLKIHPQVIETENMLTSNHIDPELLIKIGRQKTK